MPRKNPNTFSCPHPGCERTFTDKRNATNHHNSVHLGMTFPCEYTNCGRTFTSSGSLQQHVDSKHLQKFACDFPGCGKTFSGAHCLKNHINNVHRGLKKFSCEWSGCEERFSTNLYLQWHVNSVHLGIEIHCDTPGCNFVCTRPDVLRRHRNSEHLKKTFSCNYVECKGKSYKTNRGLKNHVNIVHLGKRIPCEHQGCKSIFTDEASLRRHIAGFHTDKTFYCNYREKFGCNEEFPTEAMATYHSSTHYPQVCQISRCITHLQGKKIPPGRSKTHYQGHVARGHCQDGESPPLEVPERNPGGLIDTEENEILTEQPYMEDLTVTDAQESETLSGQSVIDILGRLPENQELLRKLHRSQFPNYRDLKLKCPGPGIVIDGLVMGTDVCPNHTTISISSGTVVFRCWKDKVNVGVRCGGCQAHKDFNRFLITHGLEAKLGQRICCHETCVQPLWKGTRLCKRHLQSWAPENLFADSLDELKQLFLRAASKQWSSAGGPMDKILEEMKSDENFTSHLLHIDLEFSIGRQQLYQIGIADFTGGKMLNCLPVYSEGVTPQLSKSSQNYDFDINSNYRVKAWESKMQKRAISATDGGFNAKRVKDRLGVITSNKTVFVSWAGSAFDVGYVRKWLDAENVTHNLPEDNEVCLLYHEFRVNLKRHLGDKCFRNRAFPLSLSFIFPLLFETHDLVGHNHDALVDARQLAILHRVFLDLCRPPGERTFFKGTLPVYIPGMQKPITAAFRQGEKRQIEAEEYVSNKMTRLDVSESVSE